MWIPEHFGKWFFSLSGKGANFTADGNKVAIFNFDPSHPLSLSSNAMLTGPSVLAISHALMTRCTTSLHLLTVVRLLVLTILYLQ